MSHNDIGAAVTGFVSTLTFGRLLGFISIADVSQALILGFIGAVGGWLGKEAIIWIVNKCKSIIINRKIKQKTQ